MKAVNGVSSSSSSTSGYDQEDYNHHHQQPSLACLNQNLQPVPQLKANPASQINDDKLIELMERTGYNIVQKNGQRIFGGPPPGWTGVPPCKGTEIFVGKVPRNMFEWELVPIFQKVIRFLKTKSFVLLIPFPSFQCGNIYEMRLMMDFSGSNRGYLFVRYTNREEAKRAVKELNNFEIKPGKSIGVINSVDNRKLWISGIPKDRSAEEIKQEMANYTDGVTSVYLYNSHTDKKKTRGYAFIEYVTHRAAALARRKLVPGRITLFDQEIDRVDWAEPENEVDEEIMAKVKVLFIRNLSADTTEDMISAVYEERANGEVERVKKAKDYAFVHFITREAAEMAYESTKEGIFLDGCKVEVSWSKPIDRQIHNQRKQLTKVLTNGSPVMDAPIPPPIPMANNNHIPHQGGYFMPRINGQMIAPRPRGAAGIRGLGAPGTPPPRSLMRKLANPPPASAVMPNNQLQEYYEMYLRSLAEYAASAGVPPSGGIPQAPISPPASSSSSGQGFFNGNMRMMAPPTPLPFQSPLYYYGI